MNDDHLHGYAGVLIAAAAATLALMVAGLGASYSIYVNGASIERNRQAIADNAKVLADNSAKLDALAKRRKK